MRFFTSLRNQKEVSLNIGTKETIGSLKRRMDKKFMETNALNVSVGLITVLLFGLISYTRYYIKTGGQGKSVIIFCSYYSLVFILVLLMLTKLFEK